MIKRFINLIPLKCKTSVLENTPWIKWKGGFREFCHPPSSPRAVLPSTWKTPTVLTVRLAQSPVHVPFLFLIVPCWFYPPSGQPFLWWCHPVMHSQTALSPLTHLHPCSFSRQTRALEQPLTPLICHTLHPLHLYFWKCVQNLATLCHVHDYHASSVDHHLLLVLQ